MYEALMLFSSPNTKPISAALYSQQDMNVSMNYYFLPISYEPDYVLYVF